MALRTARADLAPPDAAAASATTLLDKIAYPVAHAIDMDNDGDVDALSASVYDDTIAWHENDGSESFTEHEITTLSEGVWDVQAADVDGDGDLDALAASYKIDTVACQCRS